MKKPNFFIIGAPKCGTTSFAHYLSEHPDIFMSEIKEPCYFSSDITIYPGDIKSLDKYEKLFTQANSDHIAVGEASTQYLFSGIAVQDILEYNPEAKFIVMLRNPIKMAPSLHFQQLYSLNEEVEEFEKAWHLQDERKKGNRVPPSCQDPQILLYGDWCKLGQQMTRLFEQVEKAQVLTILLDDLKADPQQVYHRALRFLSIPDDNRKSFPKLNASKTVKSKFLERVIRQLGKFKRALGIKKPLKVSRLLNNTREQKRQPLSSKMERELLEYFRDDIKLLEKTIHRDLSSWTTLSSPEKNDNLQSAGSPKRV